MDLAKLANPSDFIALVRRYWGEYVVIGVLGKVPTPLGALLRNVVYRTILPQVGQSTYVYPNVQLVGARNISIGSRVSIRDLCYVKSDGNPISIGDDSRLGQGVHVVSCGSYYHSSGIKIGKNSLVGPYTCIEGPGKVEIGSDCMLASHIGIYANNHSFDSIEKPMKEQALTCKGITIGDDCWLGSGVKVLDGVAIGKGSVIGAGAVVNRDIPPYSIAVGVPAKVIRKRTALENFEQVLELEIPLNNN